MARNGRTKVIYKGTFISKQSLCTKHKQGMLLNETFSFSQLYNIKKGCSFRNYLIHGEMGSMYVRSDTMKPKLFGIQI